MHDLIVIGDDLSSHVAAAVAAGYGLDTVLLARYGIGGVCLSGDLAFNIDPTPLSGFGASQTCLSLLAELDIPLIEQEGILLNPAYQIILPGHRIDFYNDKDEVVDELIREFPLYAREISAFYDSIEKECHIFIKWLRTHPFIQPQNIKEYFDFIKNILPQLAVLQIEKIKFKALLSRDAALKKVFEAEEALLGGTTGNKYSFSSSFLHCAPFRGVYYFRQGKQLFFNSLIKKLESKNGMYLSGYEVLQIKKGSSIEIEIADKERNLSVMSAKKLIVSTKSEEMPLLQADNKYFNFDDWIKPVGISCLPFMIHMGCKRQCFPEKMARHLAVVTDVEKEIFDNNLIILELNLQEDVSIPPAGTTLTATVFLPNNEDVWSRENLSSQASLIIDRLEYFLPFLKENIEFFDLDKSIEISKISRSVYSPKYKMRNSLLTGFAARTNKTRFENVYLTGASLAADTGFEGEIISGMNAATRVIKRKG